MADITVKGNGGASVARSEWDPARWMRDLLRWDPFREMSASLPGIPSLEFAPAFEIKEDKDGYVFTSDLPGVAEKDIEVSRTGNRLTISGKREAEHEEKTDTYYARERSYGSFARSFTLPDGVDGEHIRADLKDGVLRVVVPKKPEAQPQKISIKSGAKH